MPTSTVARIRTLSLATVAATAVAASLAMPASAASAGTSRDTRYVTTQVTGLPKGKYIAYASCKAKGRWFKGYVKTTAKPTKKKPVVPIVEWGYAIQKTSGNHANTRVMDIEAVKQATGTWRYSGGAGYTGWNAKEDNHWHKAPWIQYAYLGVGNLGALANVFWVDFDKGTGGHCEAWVTHLSLKPIK
ncbi:hypothetical protein [Actinoallomurus sp. NPDC050550]|uniref:hypothetical protein n=1 Tax=Actinoallomurus sp. NPDC050550 TaxID=3154937 RepID=UPI0033DE3893